MMRQPATQGGRRGLLPTPRAGRAGTIALEQVSVSWTQRRPPFHTSPLPADALPGGKHV